MTITQVHLVQGTIIGHFKMCIFIKQHNATSHVLRECVIGMLTAGMPIRVVAREWNVHVSTISRLQCCFRSFGSMSNLTTADLPTQVLHIQLLHLWDRLRPATQTVDETEEYFYL
jgi:hypothetical protein